MRQQMIRYQVRPGLEDKNAELVRAVYAELHATRPDGFHYGTFTEPDGVSFVHLAVDSGEGPSPIQAVRAFAAFQDGIAERCIVQPVGVPLTEIGSYRLFGG